MRRRAIAVIVILAAVGLAVFWPRTVPAPQTTTYVSFSETIMAAPITVMAPEPVARDAASVVFNVFRDVDAVMSEWKPTSALTAVNQAAGREAIAVPDELRALIRRGLEIGERTDGAFDVTWAALWGLWDFTGATPHVPDEERIEQRAALVDYRLVEIDDERGTVYLPREGMMIGLGGIAKGHALDRAAKALRGRGIDSFLISAAGQMIVGGLHDDRPWRVGIRDPRGGANDSFSFLEVTNTSVSTSGDYERYFMLEGTRYHHILDPRTGHPARAGVRSATVVCADATLADALSTAMVILGVERSLELAASMEGVEALLVDDEAEVHMTPGLEDQLNELHDPRP